MKTKQATNDSKTATGKRKETKSHKGSHAPQNDSTGFSEAYGPILGNTKKHVGCSSSVLRLESVFGPRRRSGLQNNGIDSGNGCIMDKLRIINGLDQMPDAQIVERKVYDGQRVAHFYAYGDLARKIIATGGQEDSLVLVVRLLPMDDVDTIETILEAEGYSVSRA